MNRCTCLIPVLLLLPTLAGAFPVHLDLGPIGEVDQSPEGSSRLKAIGPFVERQEGPGGESLWAVRPFYSVAKDPSRHREIREYLWPVGMVKHLENETFWRFLCAFGHNFNEMDTQARRRMIVFPFVYAGKDTHGERYFAVFPAGGKICEFLGRDKIVFVLFPLYAYSAVKDVKTYDVLWPLVSWTRGGDIRRVRVFPFYMRSATGDRSVKQSILWPIWTSVRYDYRGSSGGGFVLFPLYGHIKLTDQESWLVIPPLFRWTETKQGRSFCLPWPILQYSSGDPKKFWIWPLWGTQSSRGLDSSFFLWPIGRTETMTRRSGDLYRFQFLPLIYYERKTAPSSAKAPEEKPEADRPDAAAVAAEPDAAAGDAGEPAISGRYFKLWPLVSYKREGTDMRFRGLDLWPAKHTPAVERNLSPLWTVYSHVRSGTNSEDEVLWGLYRRSNTGPDTRHVSLFPLFSSDRSAENGGSRRWNVLCGLAGWEREGLKKTYRVLYFLKFSTGTKEPKP